MVIIISPQYVRELIDKRGTTTGSRLHFKVLQVITGGLNIGMMPYGKELRSSDSHEVHDRAYVENANVFDEDGMYEAPPNRTGRSNPAPV